MELQRNVHHRVVASPTATATFTDRYTLLLLLLSNYAALFWCCGEERLLTCYSAQLRPGPNCFRRPRGFLRPGSRCPERDRGPKTAARTQQEDQREAEHDTS